MKVVVAFSRSLQESVHEELDDRALRGCIVDLLRRRVEVSMHRPECDRLEDRAGNDVGMLDTTDPPSSPVGVKALQAVRGTDTGAASTIATCSGFSRQISRVTFFPRPPPIEFDHSLADEIKGKKHG